MIYNYQLLRKSVSDVSKESKLTNDSKLFHNLTGAD